MSVVAVVEAFISAFLLVVAAVGTSGADQIFALVMGAVCGVIAIYTWTVGG